MKKPESLSQTEFLRKQKRRRALVFSGRLFLLFFLLAAWELSASAGLLNDFIFSSPSRIFSCFCSMVSDGSIFLHTGVTVLETLLSFLLVTAAGLFFAALLWSSRTLAEILEPGLVMLNSLPKSALAPILIVWLGNGMKTIVTAAVSVALFGSILTLHNGFLSMEAEQVKLIYSLGGGRRQVLTKLLLPGSLPLIVNNMKVNVGLCLVGVIIGEFLSAQAGLGYLIIYGSQVFQLDLVMTSIVILCFLSALLYQGISMLERRLV